MPGHPIRSRLIHSACHSLIGDYISLSRNSPSPIVYFSNYGPGLVSWRSAQKTTANVCLLYRFAERLSQSFGETNKRTEIVVRVTFSLFQGNLIKWQIGSRLPLAPQCHEHWKEISVILKTELTSAVIRWCGRWASMSIGGSFMSSSVQLMLLMCFRSMGWFSTVIRRIQMNVAYMLVIDLLNFSQINIFLHHYSPQQLLFRIFHDVILTNVVGVVGERFPSHILLQIGGVVRVVRY